MPLYGFIKSLALAFSLVSLAPLPQIWLLSLISGAIAKTARHLFYMTTEADVLAASHWITDYTVK